MGIINIRQKLIFVILIVVNFFVSTKISICGAAPVKVFLFYSAACHECLDIKDNLLPVIIRKYGPKIDVQYFELNDIGNFNLMTQMEKQYAREAQNPPPTIFAGGELLDGEREIRENLVPVLEELLSRPLPPPGPGAQGIKEPEKSAVVKQKPAKQHSALQKAVPVEVKMSSAANTVQEKLNYIGISAIVVAGLVDGLNLCAFGILLMLVFFLTLTGYKKSQLLVSGIAFTAAIFIVYFLIGIGLLEFVRQIKVFPAFRKVLNLITGCAAIILAGLSARDSYRIHKGRGSAITLKLPKSIMSKIQSLIWKSSNKAHYIFSAFVLGAFIGILEFPCTGQIYFPIVIAIREVPGLRLHAVLLLLLYNLMFIVPLMLVFTSVYLGTNTNKYAEFLEHRAGIVKFCTSIIFFILGIALVLIAMR